MARWSWWDILQAVGAVASIAGLLLTQLPVQQLRVADVLLVGGLFVVIVSSILARRAPLDRVGRDAMIDTGRNLIRGAKEEVIMFGGDMSWAQDYQEAVRIATSRSKRVSVVYPGRDAPRVIHNARLLEEAGATLIPTPVDSGLRAILLDPNDHADALLYIATRTLREGQPEVAVGERGSEANYEYVARIYTMRNDWPLIRAATKIYEVLSK